MPYAIVSDASSRSFPDGDSFLTGASDDGEVMVYLGGARHRADKSKAAILIELGNECLGAHTGEGQGGEGTNVLGFARWRNGEDAPSSLVELVCQPETPESAIAAATALFQSAGFTVALCADQAGRIVDRLVRPKYNAALRMLDEGLASAADLDLTCRLGLGYPEGPIERVVRGGLAHHHDVTRALFEVTGTPAYAPARRAVVAKQRERTG